MHILYGSQGSGSSIAEAALERCGVDFRVVRASQWEPDSAIDELRRVNPLGQIPTLVLPDGGVLTESAAILIHLGLTQPDSGLLPADAARRAQVLRGLVFIAANCYSAITQSDYPERFTTDTAEAAREAVRRAARAQLHRHWEIFADSFGALAGEQGFLGGDERPGALDLMAAVVSRWSGTRAHLATHRPGFLALLQRIEADPGFAPVFARHWP
jgi:GST-like protein